MEKDYDGTGFAKAASTIGTCTANTDMRGTDSALLAASAPANFSDLAITASTGRVDINVNNDKTGYALTTADKDDIVDRNWDELRSAHSGAGSFGEGVASVQGNVTGSVASVTGAVGSVTGSVGSVAAAGITATSLAADAINAASLKTDAIDKIRDGIFAFVVDDTAVETYAVNTFMRRFRELLSAGPGREHYLLDGGVRKRRFYKLDNIATLAHGTILDQAGATIATALPVAPNSTQRAAFV